MSEVKNEYLRCRGIFDFHVKLKTNNIRKSDSFKVKAQVFVAV